jgi:D-alanyl-D-alanine carboxypeptidase
MKYDVMLEICGKINHYSIVFTNDLIPKNFYWENTNKLLNQYFIAGKTGITPSAGPCLVSHFKFGAY